MLYYQIMAHKGITYNKHDSIHKGQYFARQTQNITSLDYEEIQHEFYNLESGVDGVSERLRLVV